MTANQAVMQPESLVAQVTQAADEPFIKTTRALLKAGFLFNAKAGRPYLAHDLTLAQVDVLVVLAERVGMNLSCSEIAERTLITKGGITYILDRLGARGLVKRMPSRDDRRSVLVRLSAKGIDLFRKLYPELVHSNKILFEKAFTSEQMVEFGKLLELLNRSLEME